ncbi:hypothetical protein MCHI_001682 [Candidatus Magnetoovum chiemensis]|nr:hypothetical protein MCHI_001682 [Candidatus Magnetoovum chiemensis]
MNKSKLKRIKKDIDKLLTKGQYFEFLEKLEEFDLNEEYAKEKKDIWHKISKRSLRQQSGLEEFLVKSANINTYPDFPDVKFLFLLKEFLNNDKIPEEITALKGLSLPAEELRKKILTWNDKTVPEKKLRALLTNLAVKPEKVTKKSYTDIAAQIKNCALSESLNALSENIATVKRLNENSVNIIDYDRLNKIDNKLEKLAEKMPENIAQVLLYPFVCHTSKHLKSIAVKNDPSKLADFISSMPYLFKLTTGEKCEEIKSSLTNYGDVGIEHSYIEKKLSQAGFEEKAALIWKIRHQINNIETKEEYSPYLKTIYNDILEHVYNQLDNLTDREKKELPRVLGNTLVQDLPLIYDDLEGISNLLQKSAESMCLNSKLALLSLLLSEKMKKNKLRKQAEDALNNLQKPTEDDLGWLIEHFTFIIYPHVKNLKPLIDLYGNNEMFNKKIAYTILGNAEHDMITNTKRESELPNFFSIFMTPEKANENLSILRREIDSFKEYKVFSEIKNSLHCFPDNCFTEESFICLFNVIYKKSGIVSLIEELENTVLKAKEDMDNPFGMIFSKAAVTDHLKMKEKAIVEVLKKHWDDLNNVNIKTIEKISKIIMSRYSTDSILIRLSNLLDNRYQKGEKELVNLRDNVSGLLMQMRREKPKKRKKP